MSQDPLDLPEPKRPDSPSPLLQVTPTSAQKTSRTPRILQQLQQVWRQTQPVLKAASIRSLRFAIQTLEFLLNKLESKPPLSSAPPIAIPVIPESSQPIEPTSDSKPKILDRVKAGWRFVLVTVRSLLPAAWHQNLSDVALTGAVTGTLALLLWTTALQPNSSEIASKSPASPAVEQPVQPPAPQTPLPEITPPLDLSAPEPEQPIVTNLPVVTPAPVLSPESPEPLSSNPEQPAPRPLLKLTPEQTLIAAIENQVAEVTSVYADGLIQSIQANFRNSRLTVKMGDGWYDLSPTRQDRLATEMLKRSKQLDFSAIELTDQQDILLARSPVIGAEMVILQRRSPQKTAPTP